MLWGQAVEGTARELMAVTEQVNDERGAESDATDFLRELLADGARPAKEIFAEGRAAGYSIDQMHQAKDGTSKQRSRKG